MGVFGFQSRRKTWPCTCTEPPLCESPTTLHHAVNWRLHWEGLTTQVYREHMSPLTLESSASAQAATLQSVLVGGLYYECVVTCRRVAGRDTDPLCAVQPGLQLLSQNQKFVFKSFTTKLNM